MPRPLIGTPAGDLATQRWRDTVSQKYGSPTEFMTRIGAIGGSTPTDKAKGFAANRELARTAGAVGGSISRRSKKVA